MATVVSERPVPATGLAEWSPRVLSILRIVSGFLFMCHGTAKILHIPAQPQYANLASFSLTWWAGILELVGGFLLMIGLFTRPVAFLISGEMAVAYWMAHAPKAGLPLLNGGDAAVLYCFLFFYFVFSGPGPWSVDALWRRNTIR